MNQVLNPNDNNFVHVAFSFTTTNVDFEHLSDHCQYFAVLKMGLSSPRTTTSDQFPDNCGIHLSGLVR
ncbi:hypothetical protein KC19_8G065900 [Ceratodon purpureus]|uniref:Uncharacterized protein n=1 Tax=Ceratodon purpureus TaxID=3225 RepID=A0A8T0H1D2_CERPU|nr:hypothetical protein KC19_8G065900 [Ceratodon purpureus]